MTQQELLNMIETISSSDSVIIYKQDLFWLISKLELHLNAACTVSATALSSA
ncbi:hypothetical protein B0H16DRAFT_1728384 [Mycena metata]|uniref:Uncharacterized protein n=1 Tax=Mycena metata TaxID=1033252 RepID=A0AAD7IFF8_9AGAR|nr:hypothetical protein B0H16DRAFT_1728384 [Mycena metata]